MKSPFFQYPLLWNYSNRLTQAIENPQFVGSFIPSEIDAQKFRIVKGQLNEKSQGYQICLNCIVEEQTGIIKDIKYQMFGSSGLISILELTCNLLLGKNYIQAKGIAADLLDREWKDSQNLDFVQEMDHLLNLVLEVIETIADQCLDIPIITENINSPIHNLEETPSSYPNWETLSMEERIQIIETVLNQEIRPYIELDAGGVEIIRLTESHQLTIGYQGACTTCYSSTGSTLQAIQNILRLKIFPQITVVPDESFLSFS